MLEYNISQLENDLGCFTWKHHGDSFEKKNYDKFKHFRNLEEFWRWFVVPSTQRVHHSKEYSGNVIRQNKNIDIDIVIAGNYNYQISYTYFIYIKRNLH